MIKPLLTIAGATLMFVGIFGNDKKMLKNDEKDLTDDKNRAKIKKDKKETHDDET